MASVLEVAVACTSIVTRLGAYSFLRWIPGHHFPPLIIASTVLYLTLIVTNAKAFGTGRPSLRDAFPKLFKHEKKVAVTDENNEHKQVAIVVNDDSYDVPAFDHDERAVLKTLIFGIPDWHEWEFSYITIALNVLVTVLSLDLVFRGPFFHDGKDLKFTRLGYVDDTTAKILVREPNVKNLPIYAYLKQDTDTTWTNVDTRYYLSDDTDYTYPVVLSGLQPDTRYIYSLSNDLGGIFRTAPAQSSLAARSLTFLTSSCIKANFPYNPLHHSLTITGFKHMSKILRSLSSPASFMLFLGDFIYVDVPFRLSSSQEHYRAEYRRVYASPSWKLAGVNLPWIHTLDDHEIANDWAGGNETEPFPAASDPFMNYHVSVNPPLPPTAPTGPETNSTYFQFTQGPASFFMLDTRRYRTRPEGSHTEISAKPLYGSSSSQSQVPDYAPSMLGSTQLLALLTFLTTSERPGVHWKIVASSVPFTKNWRFGTSDTWGGFLQERSRILEAMHYAEENLGIRVVILSGDRHEFAAIRFPPRSSDGASASTVSVPNTHDPSSHSGPHEFSVGPLSMFYLPFRTFKQIDDEDVAIAYFPDGTSKLGAISISPARDSFDRSVLTYNLWVDGSLSWTHELTSPSLGMHTRSNWDTWSKTMH